MKEVKTIRPQEAIALIEELDSLQSGLYPADSNHLDSVESLAVDNVHMPGVYVTTSHRGKGLAKLIMTRIEELAIGNRINVLRLETGIYQPEAIGLYRKLGFIECGPFGVYSPDPLSIFMEKALNAQPDAAPDSFGAV